MQDAKNDGSAMGSRSTSAASGALASNFPTLKTRHVLSRQLDEHADGRSNNNLMIEQFAGYRRMRTQNQIQMKAVCIRVPCIHYSTIQYSTSQSRGPNDLPSLSLSFSLLIGVRTVTVS